jgi:hypothetical protein
MLCCGGTRELLLTIRCPAVAIALAVFLTAPFGCVPSAKRGGSEEEPADPEKFPASLLAIGIRDVPMIHPFWDDGPSTASPGAKPPDLSAVGSPATPPAPPAQSAKTSVPSAPQPQPQSPRVVIDRIEPQTPSVGGRIDIFAHGASPAGTAVRLEYRHPPNPAWHAISENRLTLTNLTAGPLSVDLRAVDAEQHVSDVVSVFRNIVPAAKKPEVRIASVVPTPPQFGEPLRVELASNLTNAVPVYEYRVGGAGLPWQQAPAGIIEFPKLSLGKLELEVRCRDGGGHTSEAVAQAWDVRSPCEVALDVRVAGVEPKEPVIGGQQTFHLTTQRSSPKLSYQYRVAPSPVWYDAFEKQVMVNGLKEGELIVQFRVIDHLCGDMATSELYRAQVTKGRFEVSDVRHENGRLVAIVTDHQTGRTQTVGVADRLDDHSVATIALAQGKLVLRGPQGGYVRLDLPPSAVEKLRTEARTTPRRAAQDQKSQRYVGTRPR